MSNSPHPEWDQFTDLIPGEGYSTPAAQFLVSVLIEMTSTERPKVDDAHLLRVARRIAGATS